MIWGPEAQIASRERRTILKEVQEKVLTRENRVLIVLRYSRDLPFRQIAVVLQSTEEAVTKMHSRSLQLLREELRNRRIYSLDHI